jgi:rod shape determining protein RodA
MNWRELDWWLIGAWVGLFTIGLISIYSATLGPVSEFLPAHIRDNFWKQLGWVAFSAVVILIIQFTAPRTFQQGAYIFYGFTLLLLGFTLVFGTEVNGAKSWLRVGGFNFQVSELGKIGAILAVSNFLTSSRNISSERLRDAIVAVVIIATPAVLILLQNDTGTALVLLALIPIILFWSGLPYGISVFIVAPAVIGYFTVFHWAWGLLATIILTSIVFAVQRHLWLVIAQFVSGLTLVGAINIILESVLKPYQVSRIKSFVNPAFDPKGNGWNIIQAKTAIGSGGITGKGFMQGTQTQLRFLPEQWTDFIFCVISEEFGFIGGALTIGLLLFLLLRLLNIAGTHKHPFAQLVIVGIAGVYFVHMLINLASASGLLPVIGIPLPFVSYGGSAFITNSLMLAICLNFDLYHREFSIYA